MKQAGLLVVVLCAPGCANDMTQTNMQSGGSDDTGSVGSGGGWSASLEWRAMLTPTSSGYPGSGDAIVRMDVDEHAFRVRISLRGDAWGTVRPWYVLAGRCSTGGAIIGESDSYPPLITDNDGAATMSIEVPVALDATSDYHVAVMRDGSDGAMPVACGTLRLE